MKSINKAVILGGRAGANLMPLTRRYPVFMVPILNKPVIRYNMEALGKNGVKEIIIAVSDDIDSETFDYLKSEDTCGITIHIHKEARPRGNAGVLKDLQPLLGEEPFLVLNSGVCIEEIDLYDLLKFHNNRKSIVTVGFRDNWKRLSHESIEFSQDGEIKYIETSYTSFIRCPQTVTSGIYLFSAEALEHIEAQNYMDIKEQLLSGLWEKGLPVYSHRVRGEYRSLDDVYDYIRAHLDLIGRENKLFQRHENSIITGSNTHIEPGAIINGPAVIGSECRIAAGSRIIGPVVIGDRCLISEGSEVKNSILWNNVTLQSGSSLENSIVENGFELYRDEKIKKKILVNNLDIGQVNISERRRKPPFDGIFVRDKRSMMNYRIYNIAKRGMDITLSAAALLMSAPIFIAIAVLIRTLSGGPIFFFQNRCGKGGRKFKMIKFRTMVENAVDLHEQLLPEKETDGPMFKMSKDPRVTKLGRILRKTSMDELPQLFNVIKGDMSLVGPRPLIMEEMHFCPAWREIRLKVTPGMTGLWQVMDRGHSSFHHWIKYDIYYVKNQSFMLDMKIILRTISAVVSKNGAY